MRSVDVKSLKRKHQSIEEAAREARYHVFAELSGMTGGDRIAGGNRIATAHTASDNAETVLLNLIRGTGLKGLCGIPPVRGNVIRPLVFCERSDIEAFCHERNLHYVIDSTNACEEFTRNKLRLSLIPLIKEINPSFDSSVTKMCTTLREDSDFLEKSAQSVDYSIKYLQTLEKPLLTRIIMRMLSHNNISLSNLRVSQVLEIINTGSGKINLEKHKFALIEGGILKIQTISQKYRNNI